MVEEVCARLRATGCAEPREVVHGDARVARGTQHAHSHTKPCTPTLSFGNLQLEISSRVVDLAREVQTRHNAKHNFRGRSHRRCALAVPTETTAVAAAYAAMQMVLAVTA